MINTLLRIYIGKKRYNLRNLILCFKDYIKYKRLISNDIIFKPKISDNNNYHELDSHYFYQNIWFIKRFMTNLTNHHVDIGSSINMIGILTLLTKVDFVDIRKLNIRLENFNYKQNSILNLKYKTNSIESLSCLHVAEHIGLGRYSDKLNPLGTKEALQELSRILKPCGKLYLSLPIGKKITYFNSHRIHTSKEILEYCNELKLIEYSTINDKGVYSEFVGIDKLNNGKYGCGLFIFTK